MSRPASKPVPARAPNSGFTLIEIVVAVLIAGLLAAIALPSYLDQVRKSRRADAFDAISQVRQQQERHRSQNPSYADSLAALRLAERSSAGHYQLRLSEAGPQGFILHVRPSPGGRQAGDKDCTELVLQVFRGLQTQTAFSQDGADSTARCWPQ